MHRIDKDLYFSLSTRARRDHFVAMEPKFIELEDKLLFHGGKRLIYMPQMWFLDETLKNGKMMKNNQVHMVGDLTNRNKCHWAAIGHWDKYKSKIVTGYYLIDELWRQHTWVLSRGRFLELTPNHAKRYFGVVLDPELTAEFLKIAAMSFVS